MTLRGSNGYFGRSAFIAYLKTKEPSAIVGQRGIACDCPLAWFLKEIVPDAQDITVTDSIISYYRYNGKRERSENAPNYLAPIIDDHEADTPLWARLFINRIDQPEVSGAPRNVTAKEALYTLEALK